MKKNKYLLTALAVATTFSFSKASIFDNPDFPWFGNPKETNMTRKIANKMRLGIWFQGRYEYKQQEDKITLFNAKPQKTNGDINNMYVRRLRFLFAGKFLDNWRFTIHTGFAPVGKYKTPDKNFRIFDAFVAYTKWTQATFLIGREKIFFGRAFSERLPYWNNIVFPLAEKSMFLGLGGVLKELYPDTAFKLMGHAPLNTAYRIDQAPGARAPGVVMQGFLANGHFDYKLGVYNAWRDGGRGIVNKDGAGYPDFLYLARVQFSPWPEANPKLLGYKGNHFGKGKHLTFGIGGYTQKGIVYHRAFSDPTSPTYGGSSDIKYDAQGYTLDVSGHYKNFTFRAEYMNVKNKNINIINANTPSTTTWAGLPAGQQNKLTNTFFTTGPKGDMELRSWWVQGAYLLPKDIGPGRPEFAILYEKFDPDAKDNYRPGSFKAGGSGSDVWTLTHFTVNYYFCGEFCKFSVEYIKVDEKYQDHKNDQILAQLVFAFYP